ncbi:hypothetical protein Cob_v011268 [Colletotrichum orbiculare MAFF 240422]|uniref:Isoaspartyl peptidase n=1 Tax=Colletotrichum orbiculare (strain 104-T / ATCC 96160 / CBS 514.97 / LARS 414 / MAFF 240422) TaxID=1213857 RepID=A0A484FDH3_COLOR|nr:hypothetical protein Cob_v011268 [Colletotrichum orbiculare MAFF 240422]
MMEYKRQAPAAIKLKPRLIIHGGAGNIKPANLAPPQYEEYRRALLTIASQQNQRVHDDPASGPRWRSDSSALVAGHGGARRDAARE